MDANNRNNMQQCSARLASSRNWGGAQNGANSGTAAERERHTPPGVNERHVPLGVNERRRGMGSGRPSDGRGLMAAQRPDREACRARTPSSAVMTNAQRGTRRRIERPDLPGFTMGATRFLRVRRRLGALATTDQPAANVAPKAPPPTGTLLKYPLAIDTPPKGPPTAHVLPKGYLTTPDPAAHPATRTPLATSSSANTTPTTSSSANTTPKDALTIGAQAPLPLPAAAQL